MNRVTKRPNSGETEFEHAEKKSRIDQPSKVVFSRNLPLDCMESELMALCCAFDTVERILILKDKGQAFIQLTSVERAVALVNFYKAAPPSIRGKVIQFEYSSREEVTTKPNSTRSRGSTESVGVPNKILMVTVTNMMYDINVDVIHQVFSKHGNVTKIVTFWKNDAFKALVEMATIESAIACQSALNGRNIYTGCNSLQVLFSKHDELRIKFNNSMARDYSNPNVPSDREGDSILGVRDFSILGTAPPPTYPLSVDPYRLQPHYREDMPLPYGAPLHLQEYGRDNRHGNSGSTPVVICSNLDEKRVSPDALFTLFGCYGDVYRVKILYKKRDTALIQFADSHQANTAVDNLDGVTLYGHQLRINPSRHSSIAPVRPGSGNEFEATHTKDYSHSRLHRFRSRDARSYRNICPPSCLLHISGIPENIQTDHERLVDLFSHQGTVVNFTFFEKNRKMALIQMESVEDALSALIAIDNFDFDGRHIRVAFARSKIRSEPTTPHPVD